MQTFVRHSIGLVLATAAATAAHATLTLTPAGVSAGFTLTTFVSGYNFGSNYGPIAQGVSSTGQIITGSRGDSRIYVFNDRDNQTLASAISSRSYTCETSNCNWAMATAGGRVYGAQLFGGTYAVFASDGSFTTVAPLAATGLRGYLGMWGNQTNGHILAAANVGLVDIDPVAGSYRTVVANLFPDGVSLSPDGTVAYVEVNGGIQSYNMTTGALIQTFATGHSPDGTGVISSNGPLNGKVVVNNNDGTVGVLDPTRANGDPLQFVIIASGGSRGDFVSPDLNNGTLFLSQNELVARLDCGVGCSFVPEPSTLVLWGGGLLGLMPWVLARRRGARTEAAAAC